jgi:hypothetical protein
MMEGRPMTEKRNSNVRLRMKELSEEEVRQLTRDRCLDAQGSWKLLNWLPTQVELARAAGVRTQSLRAFLGGRPAPPELCAYLGIERCIAYRDRQTGHLVTLEEFLAVIRAKCSLKLNKEAAAEIGCAETSLARVLKGIHLPSEEMAALFGMDRIFAYLDRDPRKRAGHRVRQKRSAPLARQVSGRTKCDPSDPIATDGKRTFTQNEVRALLREKIGDRFQFEVEAEIGINRKLISRSVSGKMRVHSGLVRWLGLQSIDRRFNYRPRVSAQPNEPPTRGSAKRLPSHAGDLRPPARLPAVHRSAPLVRGRARSVEVRIRKGSARRSKARV